MFDTLTTDQLTGLYTDMYTDVMTKYDQLLTMPIWNPGYSLLKAVIAEKHETMTAIATEIKTRIGADAHA